MTLDELIHELTNLSEEGFGDSRVRLAFQPSWPLRMEVGRVHAMHQDDDGEQEEDGYEDTPPPGWEADEPEGPDAYIVWITDGGHPDGESPYAPGNVFR